MQKRRVFRSGSSGCIIASDKVGMHYCGNCFDFHLFKLQEVVYESSSNRKT